MILQCGKCGAQRDLIESVYHQGPQDCIDPRFKFEGEHFHCTCTKCLFEWPERAEPEINNG